MQKRKKAFTTSICLLAVLALFLTLATACDDNEEEGGTTFDSLVTYDEKAHGKEGAVYFEATVLEVLDTHMLVAPIEGKNEGMQQDQVLVNRTTMDGKTYEGFSAGDKVGVLCAPMVTMSLPAQVPSVYGFYKV